MTLTSRLTRPAIAVALVAAPLAFANLALAQTAAPAKPAAQVAKPAPIEQRARQKAKALVEPQPVLAAASPEQLDAAGRAYYGDYACEFDQKVDLRVNPKVPGYVDVHFKGRTMTMKPVLSSTGALRLEDVTGRMLMIQIGEKSMLMDTKIGQRLVDNCVHPEQAKFAMQHKS